MEFRPTKEILWNSRIEAKNKTYKFRCRNNGYCEWSYWQENQWKENEIAELVLENIKKENTFNNPDLLHGSEIQTIKFILTPLIDFIEKGGKLTISTNAKTDEDIETEKLFSNLNLRIQNLSNPPSSENKLSNK